MQHSFSIIIVTWNALEHLQRFLPTVAATEYSDFEIIIANNASNDGSVYWIETNYPDCKIITYDRNYGYAAGNNRAVKYASGDILVFLNNDVETSPDWLTHLDYVFRDDSVGIAQPKLRSFKNPDYFEYAGAAGGFIDWMGYTFCRGRIVDRIEKDEGQYDEGSEIFWASGAAFAIRKDLFKESGGFDEDFDCALLHLKGQPARSTRRIMKRMSEEWDLPVVVFLDGDPWSFRIFASIAYGAIKTAHISEYLATPSSTYLGITADDILAYDLPSDDLSKKDIEALNAELSDPRFADGWWQEQINMMLEIGKKAEQQSLAKYGLDFVTDTYLPEKLAELGLN